jgi:diguanylate cyclase (GGDEF)-like protein
VIRDFGQIIQSLSDNTTVAGRIGGEEFAILLPESSHESAQVFADNLREQFQQLYLDNPEFTSSTPTTSIGLVSSNQNTETTLSKMLNQADKALYSAKNKGRNRVQWYQD